MEPEHPAESRLRVSKLTLFSHGVASLELSATVQDDVNLYLSFSESHMNDVLKSLTVVDKSGGQIAAISYEAPSQSTKRDVDALPLINQAALTSLLCNAQGASVTAVLNNDRRVSGVVLGTEWLPTLQLYASASGEDRSSRETIHLVLLVNHSQVVKHDIATIMDIYFLDDVLQKQLARRMSASLTSIRAKNNKLITISAKGTGERTILAHYAVESPVYKLTYRFLLIPRSEGQPETSSVFVQGWAIIDNPCDEDLEDIDIAIVSGLPISFRHDLYGARFVERPEEQVPAAVGPGYAQPSQATFIHAAMRNAKRGRSGRSGSTLMKPQPERDVFPQPAGITTKGNSGSSGVVPHQIFGSPGYSGTTPTQGRDGRHDEYGAAAPSPSAEASEVGDLFEYNLPSKVTLKARESALVPLVMQQCDGGAVDIYSHDVRATNTLSAVRVKNTTDATLEGGPVSVYERSRLVGEGMMKPCRPNSEQFLPYSVDLDCVAEMTVDSKSGLVISTRAFRGYFQVNRHHEHIRNYEFRSNKPDDIDLYVLHTRQPECILDVATVTTERPAGEAQGSGSSSTAAEIEVKADDVNSARVRYRIPIPAGHRCVLRVKEKTTGMTSYRINGCPEETIVTLMKIGAINERTAGGMREVMTLQQQVAVISREIADRKEQVEELERNQERFRMNLESLGRLQTSSRFNDSPLMEKYIEALSQSEEKIEALAAETKGFATQKGQLERAIQARLVAFEAEELR